MEFKLTKEEYIQKKGLVCPCCGVSTHIEKVEESQSYDAPDVYVECQRCVICHAVWEDVFELKGVRPVWTPE